MSIFDFESFCVEDENLKDIQITKWARKHMPNSVAISPNLIHEPSLFCNPNPRDLASSFIDALQNLARQSKIQMIMNFLQIQTAMKSQLFRILQTLNGRRSHCFGIEAGD